jgi:hypothetical protein
MTRQEYELIKLQLEHFEMFPYSLDIEILTLQDLNIKHIRYNLKEYCKYTLEEDMGEEEKELIEKMWSLIKEYDKEMEEE